MKVGGGRLGDRRHTWLAGSEGFLRIETELGEKFPTEKGKVKEVVPSASVGVMMVMLLFPRSGLSL